MRPYFETFIGYSRVDGAKEKRSYKVLGVYNCSLECFVGEGQSFFFISVKGPLRKQKFGKL